MSVSNPLLRGEPDVNSNRKGETQIPMLSWAPDLFASDTIIDEDIAADCMLVDGIGYSSSN